MSTYIFSGKVIPERTNVNLIGIDEVEAFQVESKLNFKLKVSIALSVISATVTAEEDVQDLQSLKNFVTDLVSLLVDVVGFDNGCGYEVQIDSCTHAESKEFWVFGVGIDALKGQDLWETPLQILQVYMNATAIQKQQLQRALAEFRRGIRVSYDTGFHTFRAIEALKQTFAGDNDRMMWQAMGVALNVADSYVSELRDNHALNQRHGMYTYMSSDDRLRMLIKAKTIISRFVKYIENGNQNLDVSVFTLLQDLGLESKIE